MQKTTKIKLFLKKNTPSFIFTIIRKVANLTILPFLAFVFRLKTLSFRKPYFKKVTTPFFSFFLEINSSNGFLDKQVHVYGNYENHIVTAMKNTIREGDVCVDIGANIGIHSIAMSLLTKEHGYVHAFEPIPYLREQMERSFKKNGVHNVVIHKEALSDTQGESALFLRKNNIGSSSLLQEEDTEAISIELTTLDTLALPKVDFIKLDVEGYEYHTLKGAEKTILRFLPAVIFEWSPEYYRKNNHSHIRDILLFFTEKKYTLYDLENNMKKVENIDDFISGFEPGLRSQTNILATVQ